MGKETQGAAVFNRPSIEVPCRARVFGRSATRGRHSWVFAVFVMATAWGAEPLSEGDAEEFIRSVNEARNGVQAMKVDFREERTSAVLTKPAVSQGTLVFRPPDRFRREVKGGNESLMVSDGRTLWIYYPEFGEVEKYDLNSGRFNGDALATLTTAFDFRDIDRHFRVSVIPEDGAHVVVLKPKSGSLKKMFEELKVRIGGDLRATGAEWTSREGDRTVLAFFNERKTNAPDALFRFEPPPGTRVTSPLGR